VAVPLVSVPVDLQKIQYFLAVMEHRNLSNAAQSLRVSQPTLSRQMSALEHEFDAPLFVRHGRGVAPTEAANRLYEGFKGLERQLRSLKSDVGAASVEPSGEVAFGIPPSPRSLLAVPLIERFAKAYPRVTVRVSEETSSELRDEVAAGVLDLAVTNLHEPMLLVGPAGAKFGKQREITIGQLADFPLILTTRPNSLRLSVETRLSRFGVRPTIRIEANTLPLMTDLVRAGLGYTVLPSCGVRSLLKAREIVAKPIAGFNITWLIARAKSRSLTFAAERFCDMLRTIAQQQIEKGIWTAP
jgi:LysR family nitrogen assimilation transcriptional regulator